MGSLSIWGTYSWSKAHILMSETSNTVLAHRMKHCGWHLMSQQRISKLCTFSKSIKIMHFLGEYLSLKCICTSTQRRHSHLVPKRFGFKLVNWYFSITCILPGTDFQLITRSGNFFFTTSLNLALPLPVTPSLAGVLACPRGLWLLFLALFNLLSYLYSTFLRHLNKSSINSPLLEQQISQSLI